MAIAQNHTNQWIEISGRFAAIMNGQTVLEEHLQYELNTQISDLPPNESFIAIAHSALTVTTIYKKASPAMEILDQKCRRILGRGHEAYGDLAALTKVFQTLGELLRLNISFLKSKDDTAATLLKLLAVQSDAHGMIIEEICRMHGVGTISEGRAFLPRSSEMESELLPV